MAFTAFTNFVAGLVTSTMVNTRIGALITELQNAVARLDITTDWTDLVLASGATQYQKKPQYRVIGGMVQLRGGISFAFTASGGPFTVATTALPYDSTSWGANLRVPCATNNGLGAVSPRTTPTLVAYTYGVPSTAPTAIILDGVSWLAS